VRAVSLRIAQLCVSARVEGTIIWFSAKKEWTVVLFSWAQMARWSILTVVTIPRFTKSMIWASVSNIGTHKNGNLHTLLNWRLAFLYAMLFVDQELTRELKKVKT
jgi:hypothetical protein